MGRTWSWKGKGEKFIQKKQRKDNQEDLEVDRPVEWTGVVWLRIGGLLRSP